MKQRLLKWVSARLVAAVALVLPLAAMAVTTTGYEDFGDTAGVVLWRGTEANFHASTVIDVAQDGSPGSPYAMTADQSATSWQRFASNQSAYASPGKVLVYDTAGTGDGYKYNPNCTFGPLSFGGMWVKTLAINGEPFSILGSGDRKTEFGATGKSTLFKFDASYTINRTGTTTFYGEATVDIAQGATFTAQSNSSHVVAVDSAATLKLKGAGTLAVTTMNVAGTLDLSATTRPTIDGNVMLDGTIILPEGTEVSSESPFAVCNGTLSGVNAYVKIGDAEAVEKSFTAVNGAITSFADPIYVFTENYPTIVPAGKTYTFVGGETAENAVVLDALDVRGTLKTQGYFSFANYKAADGATLDVLDGSVSLNPGNNWLKGTVIIESGATFVNSLTDAVNYNGTFSAYVYGTLDMGSTRWTCGANNHIYLCGGRVIGAGDGNGALDFMGETASLYAISNTVVEAPIRFRNALTPVTVDDNVTLTLGSVLQQYTGGGITKKGAGTLKFTTNPSVLPAGITVEAGDLDFSEVVGVVTSKITLPGYLPTGNLKTFLDSQNYNGMLVIDGFNGGAADLRDMGNNITLTNFTGYLFATVYMADVNLTVKGTFAQNNGWTENHVKLASLSGDGSMNDSAVDSARQVYDIGAMTNFTGTINFTKGKINVTGDAVLSGAQIISDFTVGGTLTVNGGSLTGSLTANNVAVATAGTPGPTDLLVPVTGAVAVTGTVTVNGAPVPVYVVDGEGIYYRPAATVSDGTKYARVSDALTYVYMKNDPSLVVAVLDDTWVNDGTYDEYFVWDGENKTYTLKVFVARVGIEQFTTLQAAVNVATNAGDVVVILSDLNLTESVTVAAGQDVNLYLAGKTITGPVGGYVFSNAGSVVITGEGAVTSAGGIVTNTASGASVVISNGTYTVTGDLFGNVEGGEIAVSGGTFSAPLDDDYCAEGYEPADLGNGTYGVRIDKGWIYEDKDFPSYTGSWTTPVEYGANDKITLESDNTYTANKASDGRYVTLNITASFDDVNDDNSEIAGAKAAVRLAAASDIPGNYVFQLYMTTNNVNGCWVDVVPNGDIVATTNADYTFTLVLDMTNRTYTAQVDGEFLGHITNNAITNFYFATAAATDVVQTLDFRGSGTVTSITGSYENPEAPAQEFAENQEIGSVTLTARQATWLNGQNNYAALAAKIATMDATAFSNAYLLNLNILSAEYDGTYSFTVTEITVGPYEFEGDPNPVTVEAVTIKVELVRKGALDGGINGRLSLKGGNSLPASGFETISEVLINDETFEDGNVATIVFEKDAEHAAAFYQPVILPIVE